MNFTFKDKNFFFSLVSLIIICGLYLRIGYYDDGLWSDEWISYYISTINLGIFDKYNYHLQYEGASPINLFLNSFLLEFFGNSYQNLEIFYILSGVLLLILSLLLYEEKEKKVFYLILLSLNPFLIYYSGEIRFYSFSVLFCVLSFITFIKVNNTNNNKTIIIFFLTTLISLLFNVHTISLILSYFVFNYFKKNNKKIYILLFLIIFIFLIFNIQYFLSMTTKYHAQFGDSGGNINFEFFIGYFFNIFFADKLFGAINLAILIFSIYYLRKKIFYDDKLYLSYLIIFITYAMFISYAVIISDIFFPRHFIFIIPFIIYSIVFLIFDLKNTQIRYFFIFIFLIMSIYINIKSDKPYIIDKPDPNYVNQKILSSEIKYIYIPLIKKLYSLENPSCCNYDELLFAYSNSFKKNELKILLNDEYKEHKEFWSVCIINPSFKSEVKPEKSKNCYGKLDFLEKNYKIKEKISSNSFDAYLYKKIN